MAAGVTAHFALLGQPVAHSPSPRIHAAFAAQFGQAIRYDKLDVAPEDFAATLARLHAEGYAGLNVTLPHKLAALDASAARSPHAERAGAANCLVRMAGGWHAHNTDGEGLIRDLRDNLGMAVAGRRVLLLGSGGAARGALGPLLDEQPAELVVSGRAPWNVEKLAAAFKSQGPVRPATHVSLKGDRFDLVVNATSAGHAGQAPRLPDGLLNPGADCYDLSYGQAFAPFRAWAQAAGAARIADGLGMLVEQAAVSYELWLGKRPQTAAVIAELRTGTTS